MKYKTLACLMVTLFTITGCTTTENTIAIPNPPDEVGIVNEFEIPPPVQYYIDNGKMVFETSMFSGLDEYMGYYVFEKTTPPTLITRYSLFEVGRFEDNFRNQKYTYQPSGPLDGSDHGEMAQETLTWNDHILTVHVKIWSTTGAFQEPLTEVHTYNVKTGQATDQIGNEEPGKSYDIIIFNPPR